MKPEVREYIDETIKAMRNDDLKKAALDGTNFYAATERLLRVYPKIRKQVEAVEDYGFVPPQKSKDISVAPPPGGAMMDWSEVRDEAIRERMRSYMRTEIQFEDFERVVKAFEDDPYFTVIRMCYFGEDANGKEIADPGRHRSLEEIADELEMAGFAYGKSVKTIRKKKVELVRNMTVYLFGEAGAISIEMYKAKKNDGRTEVNPDE